MVDEFEPQHVYARCLPGEQASRARNRSERMMTPYDFSQIDFLRTGYCGWLASVYAVLLERARCRRQQQRNSNNGHGQRVSSTETDESAVIGHNTLPTYVQEDMFSGEVRNVNSIDLVRRFALYS
ncbi:MAG: hypothetical protein U0Z44_01585 [Kouleothrix sp.]